ncbi:BCCT family transporter [Brachybacterium huguangmaarense]|uniref:BCCT family transporter n=1 Tax=Brachybacterium huguangmaarense TaxID=1652028 RepID=A0ABY6G4G0_9MICO|nr:BCCT family transporter [Brachybacterium huguangmaarense]UYG17844.1 BCCT family transporter [Brachybacterium huguangmaarense]
MSSTDTTKDLLEQLDASHSAAAKAHQRRPGLDRIVFFVAAAVAIAFVVWGVVSPAGLGSVADSLLNGTITNFGWLFVVAASVFTIFVIVIAFSRFGGIPLGKDDEAPQYKTSSWIAMMFATGMGIGLIFYGVGEPLFFYMAPPPNSVDPESARAAAVAMGQTAFHWTLYPWAMYAIVGLGIAYGSFRLGRSQLFSALFAGLFGERVVYGVGGKIINILAILATLFGSACSLGLGALQIGGGIQSAGIMDEVGSPVLVIIIAVLTACFVASAVSGIERGIQWLSNINMVLAVLLAVIVFIGGPTLFILNIIPSTIGEFIRDLPQMASRTAANGDQSLSDWLGTWTIFYWAWWVSWSPFVGLFIARISRGRTIRQFVTGVLLVPSAISIIWFAIFGGGAIGLQQRAEAAGDSARMLADKADSIDFDLILFDLLRELPVPSWVHLVLMVLAVVLVAIFFVTGADSASIVMGGLSENGAEDPKKFLVIFWGVATGAVAAVMLLAGGSDPSEALNGLKNITIVSSLPFVIVMLLLCISLWKDLSRDPMVLQSRLARHVLVESVADAVEIHDGEVFRLHTETGETPVLEEVEVDDESRLQPAGEGHRATHRADVPTDGAAPGADADESR